MAEPGEGSRWEDPGKTSRQVMDALHGDNALAQADDAVGSELRVTAAWTVQHLKQAIVLHYFQTHRCGVGMVAGDFHKRLFSG